jgi:hypothetical protein
MTAPQDQTAMFSFAAGKMFEPTLAASLIEADDFFRESASRLSACLGAGEMQSGMVQGSGFCAFFEFDAGFTTRGLLSPEELTVSMASQLVTEADYE